MAKVVRCPICGGKLKLGYYRIGCSLCGEDRYIECVKCGTKFGICEHDENPIWDYFLRD